MVPKTKQTPTTKTIDEFSELLGDGRLDLTPDFQRNSVWPAAAKGYLVDTMLKEMPVPLLFLSRGRDTNTNRLRYRVIDGQQRIRAALAFLHNRLSIPNVYGVKTRAGVEMKRIRYRHLPEELKDKYLEYSFVVMELSGYAEKELRDIFVRINKYVVKLNPQEMRDAEGPGPFQDFVSELAGGKVWKDLSLFSPATRRRKRDREFIAELAILLLEGPQDKKGSVGLYYGAESSQFRPADGKQVSGPIVTCARLANDLLSHEETRLFLKLPAFYGFMGALFNMQATEDGLSTLSKRKGRARKLIGDFAEAYAELPPLSPDANAPSSSSQHSWLPEAHTFRLSVSRQTDNIKPRVSRIAVIEKLLVAACQG